MSNSENELLLELIAKACRTEYDLDAEIMSDGSLRITIPKEGIL